MRQSLNGEKKRSLRNEKLEKVYAGVHLTSFFGYRKTLINISEGFCEAQKRVGYSFIDYLYGGGDRIRTYVGFPRRSYRPTEKTQNSIKTMVYTILFGCV